MFDYLKKKLHTLTAPEEEVVVPVLFGLHLGGSFALNDIKMRLIQDDLILNNAAKTQIVEAVGVVPLKDGATIIRYYTDDDAFIQFILNGGVEESDVVGCKLWYYYETRSVASESAWDKLISTGISQADRELEGKHFTPIWQDEGGICPPVAMTETTHKKNGKPHETDQFIMVYETQVREDLYEYLMISGEESIEGDQREHCLVMSTGIDLSASDIEVIG